MKRVNFADLNKADLHTIKLVAYRGFMKHIFIKERKSKARHTNLHEPVQQNGPHFGLQGWMLLNEALVMDILQLFVQHLDPHII